MAAILRSGVPLDGQDNLPAGVVHLTLDTMYAVRTCQFAVNGAPVPFFREPSTGAKPQWMTPLCVDLSGVPSGPVTFTATVTTNTTTPSTITAQAHVGPKPAPIAETPPPPQPTSTRPRFDPPELTNPVTLDASDLTGADFTLDPAVDYIVRLPGAAGHPQQAPLNVKGGLKVAGGHNVVIIGGAIEHATDWLADTGGKRGLSNRAIGLYGWTGTLHLEGVELLGPHLYEGINVHNENPDARLQVANVRSARDPLLALGGSTTGGGHEGGDLFQITCGTRAGIDIDLVTAHRLSSQGFFFQVWGPPGTTHAQQYVPQTVRVTRVNLSHWSTTERDYWRANHWPPNTGTYTTFQHGSSFLMAGKMQEPGSGLERAYHFDEVYFTPNPDRAGYTIANCVLPDTSTTSGIVKRVQLDDTGRRVIEWDTHTGSDRRLYGRIQQGTPPGGDFVKDGTVGVGYIPHT